MAISQIISFLNGARRLAKLDPSTDFPGQAITPEQFQYHRVLVRAGKIGAFSGGIFGIWMSYELYLHPADTSASNHTAALVFVAVPLMMVVAGILGAVSWAGVFMPGTFLRGPVGAYWMKFTGAKGPASARLVAFVTALLITGLFVFLLVCARLGKF